MRLLILSALRFLRLVLLIRFVIMHPAAGALQLFDRLAAIVQLVLESDHQGTQTLVVAGLSREQRVLVETLLAKHRSSGSGAQARQLLRDCDARPVELVLEDVDRVHGALNSVLVIATSHPRRWDGLLLLVLTDHLAHEEALRPEDLLVSETELQRQRLDALRAPVQDDFRCARWDRLEGLLGEALENLWLLRGREPELACHNLALSGALAYAVERG